MRRKMVAIICILTMLLSLTACASAKGTNNKEEKMGRYVEQQIEPPDLSPNEQTIGVLSGVSDEIEYYTYEYDSDAFKVYCYRLVNNAYEKEQVDWASKAANTYGCDPVQILTGQDGRYYMLGQKFEVMNIGTEQESYQSEYHLVQLDASNKEYTDITPDSWKCNPQKAEDEVENHHGITVNSLQISKNGLLCYQADFKEDMHIYDIGEKKELEKATLQTEQSYTMKDNKLYYIPIDEISINCYDLESDQEESYPVQKINAKTSIQVSSNGDIYLVDSEGIHSYKNGGTIWETVVDGSICSMSIPSYEVTSFFVTPEDFDTFYVMYTSLIEYNKTLLKKYCYDPTVASTYKKELSVYSLWDNVSLREAIFDYMEKHPDTKVKYTVAVSDNSTATINDYIRELNTEILSGKGPDIILLDGLSMESYIQKGVLLDTSDIFSELTENGTLLKNIAENYIKDGKVYGMPMRFYVPVYAFDKDIENSVSSISSLAKLCMNSEKKLCNVLPYDTLLTMFLYTYPDEIKGADGLIDPAALKEFLDNIKTIADQINAVPEHEGEFGVSISSAMGYNQRIQNILCGNASELLISDICASMGYVSDMTDWKIYEACTKEVNGTYESVNHTYIPNGIIGINKSAKDTELAKDFVKSLYGEDLQKKHMNDGFPMNAKALNQWMEEKEEDAYFSFAIADEEGKVHVVQSDGLSIEGREKIHDMLLNLTNPVNNDATIQDMIVEGGLSYLRGETTLDQAVQEITDKINLYLNE